jgi:hypothetical protein
MPMCVREPLDPDFLRIAMRDIPTSEPTGVNAGPGDIVIAVMLAPSVEAAAALIESIDAKSDDQ